MSKKIIFISIATACLVAGSIILLTNPEKTRKFLSPLVAKPTPVEEKPLKKYYFDNLAKQKYQASEINLVREINTPALTGESYKTWLYTYQSDNQTVSGMAKIPNSCQDQKCPVIIMLRGYVDDEIYFTGIGTHKAAGIFAENGYITLAPDFLGFGESDSQSTNILKARFNRPITVLNLIESVKQWDQAKDNDISLWAHSNGGQIALSVLEISQENYPTTLWAPVTAGFPTSVFYYMDDYEKLNDQAKEVYNTIHNFCEQYNCNKVSIDQYYSQIQAPIQLHQGGADPLVPLSWSTKFANQMKQMNKEITYYTYPESDHNLSADWDEVVEKDLEFFNEYKSD
jgi:esterase/lipase